MRRSPPRSPPKSKNPSTKIPENIRDPSRTFREHSSPSCPPCPLLEQKTLGTAKGSGFSILAKEELINSSKDLECGEGRFLGSPATTRSSALKPSTRAAAQPAVSLRSVFVTKPSPRRSSKRTLEDNLITQSRFSYTTQETTRRSR